MNFGYPKLYPLVSYPSYGGGATGISQKSGSAAVAYMGTRGVFGGGDDGNSDYNEANRIDYITIASTGNATDFGDLTVKVGGTGAFAGGSRGIWGGGEDGSNVTNVIGYITISSTGNATDFGDLTVARRLVKGMSNGTRGVWVCGLDSPSPNTNVIDYVTIETTGNATDFGDSTISAYSRGTCSNGTLGLSCGG